MKRLSNPALFKAQRNILANFSVSWVMRIHKHRIVQRTQGRLHSGGGDLACRLHVTPTSLPQFVHL